SSDGLQLRCSERYFVSVVNGLKWKSQSPLPRNQERRASLFRQSPRPREVVGMNVCLENSSYPPSQLCCEAKVNARWKGSIEHKSLGIGSKYVGQATFSCPSHLNHSDTAVR